MIVNLIVFLMEFDEQFHKITIQVGFLHEYRKISTHPTKSF